MRLTTSRNSGTVHPSRQTGGRLPAHAGQPAPRDLPLLLGHALQVVDAFKHGIVGEAAHGLAHG